MDSQMTVNVFAGAYIFVLAAFAGWVIIGNVPAILQGWRRCGGHCGGRTVRASHERLDPTDRDALRCADRRALAFRFGDRVGEASRSSTTS
jgi:hypothetical protein